MGRPRESYNFITDMHDQTQGIIKEVRSKVSIDLEYVAIVEEKCGK